MLRQISRKTVFTLIRLAGFVGGAEAAGLVFKAIRSALRAHGHLP